MTLLLRRSGLLGDAVNVEHYHDLGKLLFGWIVFWSYISFAQFFLTWYSNIPDEVAWFHKRWHDNGGTWKAISLGLDRRCTSSFRSGFSMSRNIKRTAAAPRVGRRVHGRHARRRGLLVVMPNYGPLAPSSSTSACLLGVVRRLPRRRPPRHGGLLARAGRRSAPRARPGVRERIGGREPSNGRTEDVRNMATDKSEPRVGLIFKSGVLAIVTLLSATRARSSSYFDAWRRPRSSASSATSSPRRSTSLRADEKQRLSTGPMPIDKAMQMLAEKGRMSAEPRHHADGVEGRRAAAGLVEDARRGARRAMTAAAPRRSLAAAPARRRGAAGAGRRRRRRHAKAARPPKPRQEAPVSTRVLLLLSLATRCVDAGLVASVAAADARAQAWQRPRATGMPNDDCRPSSRASTSSSTSAARSRATRRSATPRARRSSSATTSTASGRRCFVFAYHTCPMLCSLVLDATVQVAERRRTGRSGDEFDVVSISIDPHDTPETATRKRAQVRRVVRARRRRRSGLALPRRRRDEHPQGHRRRRLRVPLRRAAEAVRPPRGHLSPHARRARSRATSTASSIDPSDVRLGLLEASEGRSITTTERILLYCYHYDPQGKHYSLVAMNVMRLGGVADDRRLSGAFSRSCGRASGNGARTRRSGRRRHARANDPQPRAQTLP